MGNIIIAIDHGYGRVKTAHGHFQAGVSAYDTEPIFTHNMLVYQGKYYIIGEEHKPFLASKIDDPDYYILTLAAIARELKFRGLTSASVHLAIGLPLTWVGQQKQAFREYLLQNETADFTFNGMEYHVSFADADVFPQGYSAIATQLHSFKGTNMLCDIGNTLSGRSGWRMIPIWRRGRRRTPSSTGWSTPFGRRRGNCYRWGCCRESCRPRRVANSL